MSEMNFKTIAELFKNSVDRFGNKEVYSYKSDKNWVTITFLEAWNYVKNISNGFYALGFKAGTHVGIIADNSVWWALFDYSTIFSRGVLATIYPTLTPKQIKWISMHAEARYLVCGTKKLAEKVLAIIDHLNNVDYVIMLDNSEIEHEKFITLDFLLQKGKEFEKANPHVFEEEANKIKSSDVATLIYTSGTTGEPKGVMLTHENICSNVISSVQVLELSEDDRFLSFLPLSHSFERTAGHFLPTSQGSKIFYAENLLKVADNIKEVKPTLMVSVPRLYEKIYGKILNKISADSFIKQKIFWWAVNVGKKCIRKEGAGKKIGPILSIQRKNANKLVYSKIKEQVGGQLRYFVSGGAPLPKEIGEFFNAIGVTILEGYGLTETSPVISVNRLNRNKVGTVGPAIPGVQVDIAHDGEIIIQGPNIMKGYYKEEAATAELFDREGWFHTGDIGEIDEDGYIRITDRKRNIIVTAGGKNVAPAPMENILVASKWIEQAVILGDKQKYISALIVPAFSTLEEWAKNQGIKWNSTKELIKLPAVKKIYDQVVLESMDGFAQFEKVRKYILLPEEFSIEKGELTPSLKIKRNVVMKDYENVINELYGVK
ncbi:MAG: long-chain fatty acid--CoA ligase [Candidatus Marinimicrobia bacterium]|nr:long-chain fatty acid--CoA ligase [Candidatus Neomarinimicrobiota bacterium]